MDRLTTRGPWARVADAAVRTTDDRDADTRPRVVAHARPAGSDDDATGDMDTPTPPSRESGDDRLIDPTLLVNYGGFVLRAVGRHKLGALLCMVLVLAATVGVAMVYPKTYEVDGRMLVQHTDLVSSLVNPDRVSAPPGTTPATGAEEIVHSRDHLISVMQATDLIPEWDRTRPPALRLKDRIFEYLRGKPTDEQRVNIMIGLLDQRLKVGANEEGTISFVLRWPEPNMARAIVEKAMQTFLEYRRKTESAAITDSIAILDRSADALEGQVNATLAQMPRGSVPAPVVPRLVRRPAVSGPAPETTVRLARLKSALEARQQEVARLDSVRQQQLADAQARLSAARTVYTSGHPTVLALQQTVAQLSVEPADLQVARREARQLEAEYDALSARVGVETETAEQERELSQQVLPAAPIIDFSRVGGDANDPVGLRLKAQMAELASVRSRASAARAELASFEAGFKYQYTIVRPPQLPREAVGPNLVAILAAGAFASLLLALAFAVTADLVGGRLLEAWQLERLIGAPVSLRVPRL